MNIFLIEYRCSGKTSVGRALSQKLGQAFVDADERLVQIEGKTIAETVAVRGWDYFRRREKEVLRAICIEDNQVVATGGGVVLDPANVIAMKNCGSVVWLRAEAKTVRRRMQADERTGDQRPALTARGPDEEIEATLRERAPYYQAAMDLTVDTDDRSIDEICEMILKRLGNG